MRSATKLHLANSSAKGYERLLLAAMLGDATVFSHRDGVEATWALFTPILDAWAKNPDTSFPNYSAGSWGPSKVATPLSDEAPGPDLISIEDMRFVQMKGR
jgi:glucose-6-phosphate 1-dehydrogenase